MLSGTNISFAFGKTQVLQNVSVRIPRGEAIGLYGPSGQGKSTLARILALLLAPDKGSVSLNGTTVEGIRTHVPKALRGAVAMVLQSPIQSVDPRMNLRKIITQPLRSSTARSGNYPTDPKERLEHALEHAGLTADMLTRTPDELSGGQLQRACIARAILQQPDYIILDEATSMLDATTTASLVRNLQRLQVEHHIGMLAISHDHALLKAWVGSDSVCSLESLRAE